MSESKKNSKTRKQQVGKAIDPWPARRQRMLDAAYKATAAQLHAVPTNLIAIAQFRRVRRIRFQPLLVCGGLAVTESGFEILVNSSDFNGLELETAFSKDGTGRHLPDGYKRQMRFTIAHELAHTFQFNLNKNPPENFLSELSSAALASLERACNDVAGAILLPSPFLVGGHSKCTT